MEVSSALMKNAKPTPKKRVGRPTLNDTSSSLDTSFSPKRPRKAPDLREVIPDIRYDKHEHCVTKKQDWAVQNVKKVFVLQKTGIVSQIFMTYLTVEIGIFYQ